MQLFEILLIGCKQQRNISCGSEATMSAFTPLRRCPDVIISVQGKL